MRNAFAEKMTELGQMDERLMLLTGDIGNRLFDKYKAVCPDRFINCGIAEQNMTGVAAGLAMSGMRPVTYTITPFVTTRCLEQIRTDICYHDVPVIVVSVGAGLAYAGLGPTHHACEDISFLRSIPNMVVVCPGDAWEVRATLAAALKQDKPLYMRMGKKNEPTIHTKLPVDFEIGKALVIKKGNKVCLLSTGNMLPETVDAGKILEEQGYSTEVVSFHTVKPLDHDYLTRAFAKFDRIVTIEEHSVVGGFGSAVAEWVIDNGADGRKMTRIGTPDMFFKKSGEQDYAREQLGLISYQMTNKIIATLD